jgi:hypothetical protein
MSVITPSPGGMNIVIPTKKQHIAKTATLTGTTIFI